MSSACFRIGGPAPFMQFFGRRARTHSSSSHVTIQSYVNGKATLGYLSEGNLTLAVYSV